jgi:hypothetical protein
MSIRVNLLKPSEARRQGVVGVKFMIQISIATAVLILLIAVGLSFVHYQSGKRDLEAARNYWKIQEPLYKELVKMKENLETEKKFQQELRGWHASRIDWTPLLLELRKICPPMVQLRRLGIRGNLFIKQKPVVEAAGGETPEPSAAPSPGQAMRWYSITIDGKASGGKAEDVVIQFVRTLGSDALFKQIFESPPRLNSLQRDASQGDEQPNRVFTIEGLTLKREIKEPRAAKSP